MSGKPTIAAQVRAEAAPQVFDAATGGWHDAPVSEGGEVWSPGGASKGVRYPNRNLAGVNPKFKTEFVSKVVDGVYRTEKVVTRTQ